MSRVSQANEAMKQSEDRMKVMEQPLKPPKPGE